ncbi:MAG: tyrosine-type recombinase/integrase [Acidobacteriaceae bacterium]|nr:tyrosine-type recombinase/integrase [Acidobacteriaceae bacterium]
MARPSKHDGVIYRRSNSKVWWMRYRDRDGRRKLESTHTEDWQEAQRALRERLQARDENTLEVVRKGESLTFGEWADFFLEHYSKPPMRALKTHAANQSAVKTLRQAFGMMPLIEMNPLQIEAHLRTRLRQRKTVRRRGGMAELPKTVKPTTVHQEYRVLRRILNVAVKKKLCRTNPCSAVEFPVSVQGLFRPHHMTWSEQERIESHAPAYLRHVIRIITETGLRVDKELAPMRKEQVDLKNRIVFIPDSKTPTGVAEVPLTDLAAQAFADQIELAGPGPWLFPSDRKPGAHQTNFKKVWERTLRKAQVPYFRLYDLRSTYATRLSAGGVADEWVTQLLRQSDAQVFKKYSQMKLGMKREALAKLNRQANESDARKSFDTAEEE